MKDKDWLDRLLIAYHVYKEKNTETQPIKEFLKWVYQQYGMIIPKDLKD